MAEQIGERQTRTVEIAHSRADADGQYEITIAANSVARDNYDLDLGSLRVDNYLRNPVVLWAHDTRQPPIGRTRGIERVDGKIRAQFEFLEGDPFADRVRNAWDQGFIRAASISWGGGDISFLDAGRIRESNAELYEWSLVPVPADADALRTAERAIGLPEGLLGGLEPLAGPDHPLVEAIRELNERIDRFDAKLAAAQLPAATAATEREINRAAEADNLKSIFGNFFADMKGE
jgi:hypothetical protein